MTENQPVLRCSFCNKSQHEVRKLVAGTHPAAFICDECVLLSLEICSQELFSDGRVLTKCAEVYFSSLQQMGLMRNVRINRSDLDALLHRGCLPDDGEVSGGEIIDAVLKALRLAALTVGEHRLEEIQSIEKQISSLREQFESGSREAHDKLALRRNGRLKNQLAPLLDRRTELLRICT